MTSPTGSDNSRWENGLMDVLAAKSMDRSQFMDKPWISLVTFTRESYRRHPWNHPMPDLETQEFYLYRKSAAPADNRRGTLGGFMIVIGRVDWSLKADGGSPSDHYNNEFKTYSVNTLWHSPEPLPLDPRTFDTAAETMYNAAMWLETAVNRLQNEADRVRSGDSGFKGLSADAFLFVTDNLRDEMRMLREDLNTNQDWVAMLHQNADAARSFWQGLQNAWTQFSQGKDPTGMLTDVLAQMEQQIDALNRTQGSSPHYWTGAVTDPWPFTLNFGNGPHEYNMADPAALGILNTHMHNYFAEQLQVLDQAMRIQLDQLRTSQETTLANIHDTRQYVSPKPPTSGEDDLPNMPPPGGGDDNVDLGGDGDGGGGGGGGGDNVDLGGGGGGGGDNVDFGGGGGGGGGNNVDFGGGGGGDGSNVDLGPSGGGGGEDFTFDPSGGGGGGGSNVDLGPSGGGGGEDFTFDPSGGGGGGGSNVDLNPSGGGGGGGDLDFNSPSGGGGSFGDPSGGGGPTSGGSFLGVPSLGGGSIGGGSFPTNGSRPPVRTGDETGGGVGLSDFPAQIDPNATDPGGAGGEFPGLNGQGTPGGTPVRAGAPSLGDDRSGGGVFGGGLSQGLGGGPSLPGDSGTQIPGLPPVSGGTDGGSGFGGSDDGQFDGWVGGPAQGGYDGGGANSTYQPPTGFRMGPAAGTPGVEYAPGAFGPGGTTPGSVGGSSNGATTQGGMPFYPPMGGGMGGMGGGAGGNERDRERKTWLAEDEDVWGTDPDLAPAVIGRDDTEEYVEDDRGVRRPVPQAPTPGGPARSGGQTGGRGY